MSRIAIIGAGAWGTALSIILGRKGAHQIRLWVREPELCNLIDTSRVNYRFLPGQTIPPSVSATDNLRDALRSAQIVVNAIPSQHCRHLFEQMLPHLDENMLFVSATKGLEETTLLRISEVLGEVLTRGGIQPRVGALSGPSFALEAARGDPTVVTIASKAGKLADTVQREFSDPRFRVYTNDDVIGVELGGALKNIIAIAAGICDGLGLGHNSIAALITRGLVEITRLALACGGRQETMAGLAGLGDLVLTCTGRLSRNRSVGVELGRGRKLDHVIASMHGAVAEGVFAARAALGLAKQRAIEMPITAQVDAILHEGKPPEDAIYELMTRTAKSES